MVRRQRVERNAAAVGVVDALAVEQDQGLVAVGAAHEQAGDALRAAAVGEFRCRAAAPALRPGLDWLARASVSRSITLASASTFLSSWGERAAVTTTGSSSGMGWRRRRFWAWPANGAALGMDTGAAPE